MTEIQAAELLLYTKSIASSMYVLKIAIMVSASWIVTKKIVASVSVVLKK